MKTRTGGRLDRSIVKMTKLNFYIDLLVTTGDIEPFLRNKDYQSMFVFLNKYYNAKNLYYNSILDLDFANNIRSVSSSVTHRRALLCI